MRLLFSFEVEKDGRVTWVLTVFKIFKVTFVLLTIMKYRLYCLYKFSGLPPGSGLWNSRVEGDPRHLKNLFPNAGKKGVAKLKTLDSVAETLRSAKSWVPRTNTESVGLRWGPGICENLLRWFRFAAVLETSVGSDKAFAVSWKVPPPHLVLEYCLWKRY